MTSTEPLLEIRDLKKYFDQNTKLIESILGRSPEQIQAVDGVSFEIYENESEGVIGESGCGKTTLLRTLIGLYEPTDGEILYRGRDVATFDRADWKEYRSDVQTIFQDPFNALDPKFTVRKALMEPMKIHGIDDREERMREMLERVELHPVDAYLDKRSGQLSGGELQRAAIARALVVEPSILLADEPVSMLDVSIQASVLNLLSELIDEFNMSLVYISHDLSTVSYICDDVNVMYLGRFVESASAREIVREPKHPYSQALINAVPIPDPSYGRERTKMKGAVSDPIGIGEGCRFRDRCPERMDICGVTPKSCTVEENHDVACHLYYDHQADDEQAEATEQTRG